MHRNNVPRNRTIKRRQLRREAWAKNPKCITCGRLTVLGDDDNNLWTINQADDHASLANTPEGPAIRCFGCVKAQMPK